MPVGKYYCDYCEKEFQDTSAARKRHLSGIHHQRAKALWYSTILNPTLQDSNDQILQEPLRKGLCNRFLTTGSCSYGDSCKYIHPKQRLQSVPGSMIKGNMGTSLGNLPPSLQPPPEGGYTQLPFIDWG